MALSAEMKRAIRRNGKLRAQTSICFLVILLCAEAAITGHSQDQQSSGAAKVATSASLTVTAYPQTEAGFNSQVAAIVQLYQQGEITAGRQLLEQFRLPRASDWFADQIGPAQSAALTERYNRFIEIYANSIETTIENIVANDGSGLVTNLKDGNLNPPNPRSDQTLSGIVPVKSPVIYNCGFSITSNGQTTISWMDNFTYQDGAFRFTGHGAWPFWVWEDGSDGNFPRPGGNFLKRGTPIKQVAPKYPNAANGIVGDVVLHADIDKNGLVQNITIVRGDPILAKAAIDAFKKWRYSPTTLGGQPIPTDTTVTFTFNGP